MLDRLFPEDSQLRRALAGLLTFAILSVAVGALAGWDASRRGAPGREREDLGQIGWQYGLGSSGVAAAVRQMGEGPRPTELLALLDPNTGKAAAAWPAKYAGKAPDELALDSGFRLPSLQMVRGDRSIWLQWPRVQTAGSVSAEAFAVVPCAGHAFVTVCAECGRPLRRGWSYCAACCTAAT
jgi:hypothetical protein